MTINLYVNNEYKEYMDQLKVISEANILNYDYITDSFSLGISKAEQICLENLSPTP